MKAVIFTSTIEKIKQLGKDTRHFHLKIPSDVVFDFRAGQFVNFMLDLPGQPKTIKRPYSIASPPSWKGSIDIVWKKVTGGLVTPHLWDLKEGDTLKTQGPLGVFGLKQPMPRAIIFISTGTGIAPFRAMMHELALSNAPCEVWNIFGNRYEDEILYKEEFETLAKKYPRLHNVFTVSRPQTWKGENQYVQHLLKKYITDPKDKHIYICGLVKMIEEVKQTALAMGFEANQIFFEKYD